MSKPLTACGRCRRSLKPGQYSAGEGEGKRSIGWGLVAHETVCVPCWGYIDEAIRRAEAFASTRGRAVTSGDVHNRRPDVDGEFTIYCGKCHEVIREQEEYAETPRRWFEDGRIAGEWCCPSCSEDLASAEERAVSESRRHRLQ